MAASDFDYDAEYERSYLKFQKNGILYLWYFTNYE